MTLSRIAVHHIEIYNHMLPSIVIWFALTVDGLIGSFLIYEFEL